MGVWISDRKEDYLELGPNCPPDDVAPTCPQCPQWSDCHYRNEEGTMHIVSGCLEPLPYVNVPIWVTFILDEEPHLEYERVGNYFFAHDGPFLSSYVYVPGSKDGFAGRTITVPMANGTSWKPEAGSMWSSGQGYCAEHFKLGPFMSASYRLESAESHNVGYAAYFAVEDWMWIFDGMEKQPYLYTPDTLQDLAPHTYRLDAVQEDIAGAGL